MNKPETVFISIASYRDAELLPHFTGYAAPCRAP